MILITGASSGIGAACARAFAAEKRSLTLVARRLERLKELRDELQSRWGVEVEIFELDVSDRAAVEAWTRANGSLLERVTTLVNNAGLAKGMGPIDRGTPADWDEMIDTNVKGLLYLTRAVLPGMRARGDGHVINLGSVAGYWTYPNGNVYCATKFAVRALTEGMRLDLSGSGVRVTEISPGMVETEFSQVRLGDAERAKAVYAGMIPLTPEDIAESVIWCANRPARVNIQQIVIYPTDQASPSVVARRT